MPTNPTPTEQLTSALPDIQYLLENTDCPRLPDCLEVYTCPQTGNYFLINGMTGYIDDQGKLFIANRGIIQCDEVYIAVIVGWVMEVSNWYDRTQSGFADITNEGVAGWAATVGFVNGPDDQWVHCGECYYATTLALLSAITEAIKPAHAEEGNE